MLWACDRVRLALRIADNSIEEFRAWYLDSNPGINAKEFGKAVRELLRLKGHRRPGKHLASVYEFAEKKKPDVAARVKRILFEEINLAHLDRDTGLSFKQILEITGLSKELKIVVKAISRKSVNRDKLEPIHSNKFDFIKNTICGKYHVYRLHSTIEGLLRDSLIIQLDENREVSCHGQFSNAEHTWDDYEGRVIFDGVKVFAILTKLKVATDLVDTVAISIAFDETYLRYAAILLGSVDKNPSTLCAVRLALIRCDDELEPPKIIVGKMSAEERQLFEKLDNTRPVHTQGDRVLMFDNLTLNTERRRR